MSCWPSGTSTPSILPPDMLHKREDVSQHIRQQNANNRGVSLELGKSSVVNRRKLRSKIWEDFEKYDDENGKHWAKCKVCKKVFDGSSKFGTTHLKNHLRSCQRKKNGEGGGDEPANFAGNLSNPIAIKEKSVMDQQLIHLDAARMIIKRGDASLMNSANMGYIIDVYKEEREKLRNYFKKLSELTRCLCLIVTLELSGNTFLTVWFIDDDWKLKNKIIGFTNWERAKSIVDHIKTVFLEWGIGNNLSSMVMVIDGNDNDYLYSMVNKGIGKDWFSTQGSLLFKNKLLHKEAIFSHCGECDNFQAEICAIVHAILLELFRRISHTSSDFRKAIDVAIKSLGKEVTVQVIHTETEWSLKYYRCQKAIDAAIKSLGKEVTVQVIHTETEWPEKYLRCHEVTDFWGVAKNVLGLKETFFHLENRHPHFQNLTEEEWDGLRVAYECFEGHGDFLQQYCGNYNTANTHFPLLCYIYKCSKEMRKCGCRIGCADFIKRADDCWCDYGLVLAVASVLDPRFRMDIVKNWYKQIFGDEWETEFTNFMKCFADIYNEYARGINNLKECTSGFEENSSSFSYEMLDPLGKLSKSSHELDHVQSPGRELCLYLEEVKFPPIKDFDILEWWRIHARYFPTLARMARDVLSIQFSCHRVRLSNDEMMSLSADSIKEAYTCTKSWLREEL